MNDALVPQTPGEKLAGLRQAQCRSLEEGAAATKIPLPMLEAIEQDEYQKISGDLYVKSFLRSYAREVGMEDEEILALYANFTGAASASGTPEGTPVWQEEEVRIKRVGVPWPLIGGAVAVLILVAAWFVFLRGGVDEEAGRPGNGQTPAREVTTPPEMQTGQVPDTLAAMEVNPRPAVPIPAEEETGQTETADRPLPEALPGDPNRLEIGDRSWPVVLRLLGPGPRQVAVKKDGDQEYGQVDWPDGQRPLPAGGVRAGVAYHVREGMVVYWGAEDHFSLKIDDPADFRASINGQYRDIGGMGPGQEIILRDPDVIEANLPSSRTGDRP